LVPRDNEAQRALVAAKASLVWAIVDVSSIGAASMPRSPSIIPENTDRDAETGVTPLMRKCIALMSEVMMVVCLITGLVVLTFSSKTLPPSAQRTEWSDPTNKKKCRATAEDVTADLMQQASTDGLMI
jgi:hypothetical protein